MQRSGSAQRSLPSWPSQQPHLPPSHPPTAPSLCSNPSHPLKPLSSPKGLTATRAPPSALPGGSCCFPPMPRDPLGSADLSSPERANSISQCWLWPTCQSASPECSPRCHKTGGGEVGTLAGRSSSWHQAAHLAPLQAQGCSVGHTEPSTHPTAASVPSLPPSLRGGLTRGDAPVHKPRVSKSIY